FYPNLARGIAPAAINQLWVADITYIRLRTEFVYLAVVLDAFSRRVIGWALGRTLEADLAVAALRMALSDRQPSTGLVHHSDRGVQYASHTYTEMLKQHQVTISMSRKGNPYDNAACESFMKTLKQEEVYRHEYRDFHEACGSIGEFLERVYNQKRLHSALGYQAVLLLLVVDHDVVHGLAVRVRALNCDRHCLAVFRNHSAAACAVLSITLLACFRQ